jgi:ubiquinone biosynthesis protein
LKTDFYTTPLILEKERPALEVQPAEKPRSTRVFMIAGALRKLFFSYWRTRISKKTTSQMWAVEVRRFLEMMGGVWIKVGQVLAMRNDIFPVEFCSELARLQDRSVAFPSATSVRMIEESLGVKIDEVFEEFEEVPFAAASLSQVHRGRLRGAENRVAIKVQRPYALENFRYDFKLLRWLVRFLKLIGAMKLLRLDGMLSEIHEMMDEELDYRYEASNMRNLRVSLKRHRIIVPFVHMKYTTQHVLVMEYLDGVFMSDYISVERKDPARARAWILENDIEKDKVARRLFRSVMRQIYEDLMFHADMHPGNVILLKGSRLALIDFGNCGKMDQKVASQYDQYFRAMSEHALDRAADLLLLTMGKLPPMDVDAFKKRLVKILNRQIARSFVQKLPYREKSIGSNSAELNRLMADYHIEVNWELLKMARAFEAVDQNISVLNPDFNFTSEMRRYQLEARKRKREAQMLMLPGILEQIADFSQIILPSMLQRSLSFGGSVGKGLQVAAMVFGFVRKLLFVGIVVGIFAFLFQHEHEVVDDLVDEKTDLLNEVGVPKLMESMPHLEKWAWITAIVLTVIIAYRMRKMIAVMLRPEPPGQRK